MLLNNSHRTIKKLRKSREDIQLVSQIKSHACHRKPFFPLPSSPCLLLCDLNRLDLMHVSVLLSEKLPSFT